MKPGSGCGKIIDVATPPNSAQQLAPGKLLIAAVELSDGVFDHTVVLLLDADADGALGVVLNEINDVTLESVLPRWVDLVSHPPVLFRGGPVSPQGAICLASVMRSDEEPPGWRPVFDNIGLLHLDTPVEIVEGAYADLRIFAGYAGWGPGQLEGELAHGMWYVADAHYSDVFGANPQSLWRRVLRRQGGQLAWLATWPEDPELN